MRIILTDPGSWIRIRIGNAYPDPVSRKLKKIDNLNWFPAFQNGFCTYVCFMTKYQHKVRYIFHIKITTFCDGKVWPGSGSALVRLLGSGSRLKTGSGSPIITTVYSRYLNGLYPPRNFPVTCSLVVRPRATVNKRMLINEQVLYAPRRQTKHN